MSDTFDKLFTTITNKIIEKRTSNELQCLEYIKQLKQILNDYKDVYISKRDSKIFTNIVSVEQKVNSMMDFHQHDTYAGTFLVIQLYESKFCVDDILRTIVTPRDGSKIRDIVIKDAATAFNCIRAICSYAQHIKTDNKLEQLFKKLNINNDDADAAITYANTLNNEIEGLDLSVKVKQEEETNHTN